VKGEIAAAVQAFFGEVPSWFVLGHPIAGSEQSGIAAANARLFVGHKVILTPVVSTDPASLELVSSVWQSVGADVQCMTVELHDTVLAATSHLPHALAFTLVDTLANLDVSVDVFRFAAGGFRDFTRIASSHPVMWHDIMLANKEAILQVMGEFQSTLSQLEQSIRQDDGAAILAMFERAKTARDKYSELMINRKKEN
jgi:3-phosphoshikimate 1-carboxyvinyltransferase